MKIDREPSATAAKSDRRGVLQIDVTSRDPAEQDRQVASAMLRPSVLAGSTILSWGTEPFSVGITELVGELAKQGAAAAQGDLSRLEVMLTSQAHTLDMLFNKYAQLSRKNLASYPDASETFMRLALRAQSQCRATVETLAAVKNPPNVAFVKQANIAAGHQQVNNDTSSSARGRDFPSNELLETHERLEHITPPTAGFGNSKVATLGSLDRAAKRKGKSSVQSEQPEARSEVA